MEFIKDPLLGDYFIQIDEYNYSAYKTIMPDSGTPYDSCIGHFGNIGGALKKIADNTMKGKSYDSIKQYINEYESILNKFNEKFM
jgi:hypothetical protein